MKTILLKFLCCPSCRSDLKLDINSQVFEDEIKSGTLLCHKCNNKYPIIGGVPVFTANTTETEITNKAFSKQWELRGKGEFENNTIFGFDPNEYVSNWNYAFKLNDIKEINKTVVMDAGIGAGNLVISLASSMTDGHVLGIDLSDTVFEIYRQYGHIKPLHIIRGDIQHLPIKNGVVKMAYSSGVIHHLANPSLGIKSLWSAVEKGGQLYIWVYPNYSFCAYHAIRCLMPCSHKLPLEIRLFFSRTLTPFLWLFFRMTKLYSYGRVNESFSTIAFRLFDNLSPEFQFRFSKDGITKICDKIGIKIRIINDLGFVADKT